MKKIKLLMPILAMTSIGLPLTSCGNKKQDVVKFKVTFDVDGGIPMEPIEVEKDTLLPETTIPSKPTWAFNGWFQDKEKTKIFDMETMHITNDLTLYAKWSIKREGEKLGEESEWKSAINEILNYDYERNFKAQEIYVDDDLNEEIFIYNCVGKESKIIDNDNNTIYELLDGNTPGFLWKAKKEVDDSKVWVEKCYKQKWNIYSDLTPVKQLKNEIVNNYTKFTYDTTNKIYKYKNGDNDYSLKFIDKKLKTFSWIIDNGVTTESYDLSFDQFGGTAFDFPTLENKFFGNDETTTDFIHTAAHNVEKNKTYFYSFVMPDKYDPSKGLKAALAKDGTIQKIPGASDIKVYIWDTLIPNITVTDDIIIFGDNKPLVDDLVIFEIAPTTSASDCSFYIRYNA